MGVEKVMYYICYDKGTGVILHHGFHHELPEDTFEFGFIAAQYNGETVVQNGAAIKLPPTTEELLPAIRKKRDALLAATDKVWAPDYTENGQPLSEERKESYRVYRQALRDITEQEDLVNLTWPDFPAL